MNWLSHLLDARAQRAWYRADHTWANTFRPLEAIEPRVLLSAALDAGSSLDNSRNLGTIDVDPVTVKESVGGADTSDSFTFALARPGSLAIRLEGVTASTDVRLIRDANNNGRVDDSEVLSTATADPGQAGAVDASLEAGTYFVQVDAKGNTSKTRYKLTLTNLPPDADNPLFNAYEQDNTSASAGTIIAGRSQTHMIETPDDGDWQKFTLTRAMSVVLKTEGRRGDTELRLYAASDLNRPIAYDNDSGKSGFSQIAGNLRPGTYYIRVNEFGADARINRYKLSFKTREISRLVRTDFLPLGPLIGTRDIRDELGGQPNNLTDVYSLLVTHEEAVELKVDTKILGWKATVSDSAGNIVVPAIVSDVVYGATAGMSLYILSPGAYFIAVSEPAPIYSTYVKSSSQTGDMGVLVGFGSANIKSISKDDTLFFFRSSMIGTTPVDSTRIPRVEPYTLNVHAVPLNQIETLKLV